MLCEENGQVKEYLIKEKMPEKRKESDGNTSSGGTESVEAPAKKTKSQGPAYSFKLPTDLRWFFFSRHRLPNHRFLLLLLKTPVESLKEVDAEGGSHLFVALRNQSARDVFRVS